LALLIAFAASLALASPALAQPDGHIRIIGSAAIQVVPDEVTVRIGVSNRALTPTAALDQNSGVARKLIDFTKRFGVDPRDIQTGAVSLQPNYKTVRDVGGTTRQEPDGYAANNTVHVRLADLNRLGEFMRAVLDQGATNISGVQFGITDQEKWDAEARRKAVEDAVRQANQLADAAKVKLGRIIEIAHPPRTEARVAVGVADLPMRRMGAAAAVPVEAGTRQVGAEVEMIWAIEQ
jgi:hypothetical protein